MVVVVNPCTLSYLLSFEFFSLADQLHQQPRLFQIMPQLLPVSQSFSCRRNLFVHFRLQRRIRFRATNLFVQQSVFPVFFKTLKGLDDAKSSFRAFRALQCFIKLISQKNNPKAVFWAEDSSKNRGGGGKSTKWFLSVTVSAAHSAGEGSNAEN